ncbi:hypothetical protein K492DRAFT_176158 [Lichtheimia hyalospora FSU 10163]|nr:hypothetical protein K492DRAFT_176158 [Lichtheimia hyalospora FSU 10163]
MSTALYALPFAESKPIAGNGMGVGVDAWVNDLDDFPPLSLKSATPSCPKTPSSSSAATCSKDKGLRIHREWELVEGIEFSSHTEDDWEDIDYSTTVSQGSFASTAAKACIDHEQTIPIDKFIVWPKQRCMKQRRIVKEEQWVDDNDDQDDLATCMYEAHKSQSRKASRRIPYLQRRRQQVFDVVIRRHVQTLSKEQDQYKTHRQKDERDIAAIQMMREKACQQHSVLLWDRPPYTGYNSKMAFARSLLIYELRHRGLIPSGTKSPSRPKPEVMSKKKKIRARQQMDDDELLQTLIQSGELPSYEYDKMNNQLIRGILADGVRLHLDEKKKVNTKNSQELMDYVISQFSKQDYWYQHYQRDTYHTYRRILTNLYSHDCRKLMNAEQQLTTAMASDNSALLRTIFRTLSRDCFTPRDRNMRKQLIAHHFNEWKQMSQSLSQK